MSRRGRTERTGPPRGFTLLLRFVLPPEKQSWLVGDLHEEFAEMEGEFGRRWATVWYVSQVLRSIPPLARDPLLQFASLIARTYLLPLLAFAGAGFFGAQSLDLQRQNMTLQELLARQNAQIENADDGWADRLARAAKLADSLVLANDSLQSMMSPLAGRSAGTPLENLQLADGSPGQSAMTGDEWEDSHGKAVEEPPVEVTKPPGATDSKRGPARVDLRTPTGPGPIQPGEKADRRPPGLGVQPNLSPDQTSRQENRSQRIAPIDTLPPATVSDLRAAST